MLSLTTIGVVGVVISMPFIGTAIINTVTLAMVVKKQIADNLTGGLQFVALTTGLLLVRTLTLNPMALTMVEWREAMVTGVKTTIIMIITIV